MLFTWLCFFSPVPLLHVLGFHSKILSGGGDSSVGGVGGGLHWIRQTWASITQRPVTGSEGAVTLREREVPILLRDPVTLLLQLILLLPSRIDQGMKGWRFISKLQNYLLKHVYTGLSMAVTFGREKLPLIVLSCISHDCIVYLYFTNDL